MLRVVRQEPVHGETLRALVTAGAAPAAGGTSIDFPVAQEHVSSLQAQVRAGRPTVVWDCGNGAVGAVIKPLTRALPGRHFLGDGARASADVGFAFDGDGDRLGVVDERLAAAGRPVDITDGLRRLRAAVDRHLQGCGMGIKAR